MSKNISPMVILGGGVAGLAVGYYARRSGIPFVIFEKAGRIGGNCITLRHGDFLFDSGAHRVHGGDPQIMREIRTLLGDALVRVEAPSKIYHQGKFIDFPLSPLDLVSKLGVACSLRAAWDLIVGRLTAKGRLSDFESFAVAMYGRTIAEKFLLNYSEKLWGAPVAQLSPTIAGRRLKGLGLWTVLCETFLGKKAKTRHLEGMGFYYPRGGFGMIPEQFASSCGMEHIVVDSAVTRILHDEHRVVSIEINGVKKVDVGNGHVVSTMPINAFIQGLEPKAPDHILKIAQALRFQHMVLAVLFVDRASFTKNATVYLPDPDMPFTRIYEPKNRSSAMAPKDKTCLVFEVPCQKTHAYWTMGEKEILEQVRSVVVQKGWLQHHEIINGLVHRFECAYPILERGYEQKVDALLTYLGLFKNLYLSGRNGLFAYSWLHDIILSGKEIVGTIAAAEGPGAHE